MSVEYSDFHFLSDDFAGKFLYFFKFWDVGVVMRIPNGSTVVESR